MLCHFCSKRSQWNTKHTGVSKDTFLSTPHLQMNVVRNKPGGIVLLREAPFYLDAVHLILEYPIAQCHLQRRKHMRVGRSAFAWTPVYKTACYYLLWYASLADEQQVFQV